MSASVETRAPARARTACGVCAASRGRSSPRRPPGAPHSPALRRPRRSPRLRRPPADHDDERRHQDDRVDADDVGQVLVSLDGHDDEQRHATGDDTTSTSSAR